MRKLCVGNLKLYLTLVGTEGSFGKWLCYVLRASCQISSPTRLGKWKGQTLHGVWIPRKPKENTYYMLFIKQRFSSDEASSETDDWPLVLGFVMGPPFHGYLQPSDNDFTSVWCLLKAPLLASRGVIVLILSEAVD